MELAGPAFRGFAELITLLSIEICGAVSEKAMGLLREKARLLGGAQLSVDALERGFSRF